MYVMIIEVVGEAEELEDSRLYKLLTLLQLSLKQTLHHGAKVLRLIVRSNGTMTACSADPYNSCSSIDYRCSDPRYKSSGPNCSPEPFRHAFSRSQAAEGL